MLLGEPARGRQDVIQSSTFKIELKTRFLLNFTRFLEGWDIKTELADHGVLDDPVEKVFI